MIETADGCWGGGVGEGACDEDEPVGGGVELDDVDVCVLGEAPVPEVPNPFASTATPTTIIATMITTRAVP
jgi:hypothetical protein